MSGNPYEVPGSYVYGADFPDEVGWFGGDLYRSAKKAVKSVGKGISSVAKHIPGTSLITAPLNVVSDVAKGKNVVSSLRKRGGSVVSDVRSSLPIAASVVSFVPGVGTAIGAGLNATSALAQGKSIKDIGLAAVSGAVPGGALALQGANIAGDAIRGRNLIDSAKKRGLEYVKSSVPGGQLGQSTFSVAADVARGKNVAKSVGKEGLSVVRRQLPGGQLGQQAFDVAREAAQGKNVLKNVTGRALSAAEQYAPKTQLAQTAISAARDVAAGKNVVRSVAARGLEYAASNVPGGQLGQAAVGAARDAVAGKNVLQSVANRGLSAAKTAISAQVNPMNFSNAIRPNLGLPRGASPEFIGRIRSAVGMTRPVLRPLMVGKQAKAIMRPLSTGTRGWLVNALPKLRGEVAGLTETGTQWKVEAGDTGSKIAKALTGNANRWTELRAPNPKVMARGAEAVKKYGFPVYVGDIINLPSSWITVATTSRTSSVPVPVAAVAPAGDLAAQRQARTILVAWSRSDGANQAGVSDYGSATEIGASSWSARDTLAGSSFASWWTRNGGSPSVSSGDWSDALAKALSSWAERKASAVMQTAVAASSPVAPAVSLPVESPAPTTSLATLATNLAAVVPAVQTSVSTPAAVTTSAAPAAATSTEPANNSRTWAVASIIVSTIGGALIRAI